MSFPPALTVGGWKGPPSCFNCQESTEVGTRRKWSRETSSGPTVPFPAETPVFDHRPRRFKTPMQVNGDGKFKRLFMIAMISSVMHTSARERVQSSAIEKCPVISKKRFSRDRVTRRVHCRDRGRGRGGSYWRRVPLPPDFEFPLEGYTPGPGVSPPTRASTLDTCGPVAFWLDGQFICSPAIHLIHVQQHYLNGWSV
jgi:hypothetical protein